MSVYGVHRDPEPFVDNKDLVLIVKSPYNVYRGLKSGMTDALANRIITKTCFFCMNIRSGVTGVSDISNNYHSNRNNNSQESLESYDVKSCHKELDPSDLACVVLYKNQKMQQETTKMRMVKSDLDGKSKTRIVFFKKFTVMPLYFV